MARLQYQSGSNQCEKIFKISESVLFISKDVIPDVETFVLTDPDIHHKHAAITCSDYGIYYLTDLGSETYIKISNAFERLDPMKPHMLTHTDLIRFGSIEVTFLEDSHEVKSSQVLARSYSQMRPHSQKFFVQLSQTEDVAIPDEIFTEHYIPETQDIAPYPPKRPKTSQDTDSDHLLDITSEGDQSRSCDSFSQNIFHNASKPTIQPSQMIASDDEMESQNQVASNQKKEDSDEGRSTPELEETQEIILPPVIKQESRLLTAKSTQKPIKQETKLKVSPHNTFEATQPIVFPTLKTRLQVKKQEDIKPKTVSLSQFEFLTKETINPYSLIRKVNKASFSLATQPLTFHNAKPAPACDKIVNQILISSDEDSEKENSNDVIPTPQKDRSDEQTQLAVSQFDISISTPMGFANFPINEDEVEAFLKEVNTTQSQADDELVDLNPNYKVKPGTTKKPDASSPIAKKKSGKLLKRKTRVLKYFSSDSD